MGNDQSLSASMSVKGMHIDLTNPIETTDFWTLYTGELINGERTTAIAIYKDEPIVKGQLWATQTPIERATKNLMIFRHPSILKYISSWERGSHRFLATEICKPLMMDIGNQSDVQICLGLRNILCSLIFLVEQAHVRHLNISPASIYVTSDGIWKLAGFEYLWKAKDVDTGLLERCQPYRFKKCIDPNELKHGPNGLEQLGFAVLCEETLKNVSSEMPHIDDFRIYSTDHLKHPNPKMRPNLSAILLHPFFNHEFVTIHSFLTELPLKTQQEKQHFFTGLIDRLRGFDEKNIASQLSSLLMSRMVLLDATAQLCVLPYLLRPRKDDDQFPALFSTHTYTVHMMPRIMSIFPVRDAQIRLILLEYFSYYVSLISELDLKEHLLPQLLLGIKDTNDLLVAATLRSLADLVGILGSAIVIGRNRGRLFADGRPHGLPDTATHWAEHRSITPVMNSVQTDQRMSDDDGSSLLDHVDISESYATPLNNNSLSQQHHQMPERPSPDGGEDIHTSSGGLELDGEFGDDMNDNEDDGNAWSDWEIDNQIDSDIKPIVEDTINAKKLPHCSQSATIVPTTTTLAPSSFICEIKELDIKTKSNASANTTTMVEFDFFKDMEPIIQKASVLVIEDNNEQKLQSSTILSNSNRFDFKCGISDETTADAWDDDTNEWGNC